MLDSAPAFAFHIQWLMYVDRLMPVVFCLLPQGMREEMCNVRVQLCLDRVRCCLRQSAVEDLSLLSFLSTPDTRIQFWWTACYHMNVNNFQIYHMSINVSDASLSFLRYHKWLLIFLICDSKWRVWRVFFIIIFSWTECRSFTLLLSALLSVFISLQFFFLFATKS